MSIPYGLSLPSSSENSSISSLSSSSLSSINGGMGMVVVEDEDDGGVGELVDHLLVLWGSCCVCWC